MPSSKAWNSTAQPWTSPTANTVSPFSANGAGFQAEISTGTVMAAIIALSAGPGYAGGARRRPGAMGGTTHDARQYPDCSARVVLADDGADPRHDLLTPFAAVEDAVVADPGLLPVDMAGAGNVGRQRMGRLGLTDAGNVVEFALNRHQGGLDGSR